MEVCKSCSLIVEVGGLCSSQPADGNTRPRKTGFGLIIKLYPVHLFLSPVGYAFNISGMGFLSHSDTLFSTPEDSKDKKGGITACTALNRSDEIA